MDLQKNLHSLPPSLSPPIQLSQTCSDWETNYKARVLTSDEWEGQRHTITELYLDNNLSLADARKIMAEEHNFYANEAQYKKKIKKWGLEKNLNKKTISAMLEIRERRKREGKPTSFKYRGRPVGENKLERSRKRYGVSMSHKKTTFIIGPDDLYEEPSGLVATPLNVEYFTPSPDTGNAKAESTSEVDSQSCGYTIEEDIESLYLSPGPLGNSNTDISLPNAGSPNVTNRESSHQVPIAITGFSGHPDEPIKVRSSDDQTTPSLTGAVWISVGAKSVIGSWIRDDVVMSGGSPFNFKSPSFHSSSHLSRSNVKPEFSASCCGVSFHTSYDMMCHYEENHSKQKQDDDVIDDLNMIPQKENQHSNHTAGKSSTFEYQQTDDYKTPFNLSRPARPGVRHSLYLARPTTAACSRRSTLISEVRSQNRDMLARDLARFIYLS